MFGAGAGRAGIDTHQEHAELLQFDGHRQQRGHGPASRLMYQVQQLNGEGAAAGAALASALQLHMLARVAAAATKRRSRPDC